MFLITCANLHMSNGFISWPKRYVIMNYSCLFQNVLQNRLLLELLALNFFIHLAIKLTHSGLCWICLKRVNLGGLFYFGLG